MSGERDLGALLRGLEPELREGTWVYVADPGFPLDAAVTVVEPEGRGHVVARAVADGHELPWDFEAAWITLRVHSALDAVGLTAAVATALTAEGIACNVVAGLRHDHLLVPVDRADDALAVLRALQP